MDKKKPAHPDIESLINSINQAASLRIVAREYANESNAPSLERIRSMLGETGLADKVNANDVLRVWYLMKTEDTAAYKVLYHHALTHRTYDWQNEPSPSGDDVHEWIEAYLAACEKPLLNLGEPHVDEVIYEVHNVPPLSPQAKKEHQEAAVRRREHLLQGALHVTPDDVIQTITLCKQWGFTPYNAT